MLDEIKLSLKQQREFYEKYLKEIVPVVQKNEATRKNKLCTAIITSGLSFIAGSLVLCYCIIHNPSGRGWGDLIIGLYSFSFLSWFWIKKGFENSIKEKIMPTVCGCFGNLKWFQGLYSGSHVFSSSFVIPNFESVNYDDVFKGSYNDVNIDIVESEYIHGSGKYRSIVFDGVIIKLDMNKPFTSHTLIKPNGLIHISPSSKLKHTELEDVEFNKQFDVYTNDEVDARYLITPSFMERLKDMEIAFKADSVSCVFYRKYLIIALSTKKDLFSICSLIKPIDDEQQYFQMYEEIVSIIKLIDHFKLNQKIGL